MKKVFPFKAAGKADARVVDSIKHEVRKYVKRERGKDLPEGFDLWSFACKVGASRETAAECLLGDVSAKIDEVVNSGGTEVYIEVIAVPTHRAPSSETPIGQ
jgi:hypothetical protein